MVMIEQSTTPPSNRNAHSSAAAKVIRSSRARQHCSTHCCHGSRSILPSPHLPICVHCLQHPVDDVRLEIGFGGAEHLIAQAQSHSTPGFIGTDAFVNAMAKALVAIDDECAGEYPSAFRRRQRVARLAAEAALVAHRSALSRSMAEAAALEAAFHTGRKPDTAGAHSEKAMANYASPPISQTMRLMHWRACLRSKDLHGPRECAEDWRKPWPGFFRYALRGKGQARGAHAGIFHFPSALVIRRCLAALARSAPRAGRWSRSAGRNSRDAASSA